MDALPQRTFTGVVTSIGQLPLDSSDVVRYPVRALVANPEEVLRPQMLAYARVLSDPANTLTRIHARPNSGGSRLLWWRISVMKRLIVLSLACLPAAEGPAPDGAGRGTETGSLGAAPDAPLITRRYGHPGGPPRAAVAALCRARRHHLCPLLRNRRGRGGSRQQSRRGTTRWPTWRAPTSGSRWRKPKRSWSTLRRPSNASER